jgi:hypothetical protein
MSAENNILKEILEELRLIRAALILDKANTRAMSSYNNLSTDSRSELSFRQLLLDHSGYYLAYLQELLCLPSTCGYLHEQKNLGDNKCKGCQSLNKPGRQDNLDGAEAGKSQKETQDEILC